MLKGLFSRAVRKAVAEPAPTTGGALIYAVGDVHGRRDLLETLLGKIEHDIVEVRADSRPVLVFIGDYVDRGPESRAVLERLIGLSKRSDIELRALKGNHEAQLLSFLEDARAGAAWLEFGGGATLQSYGVAPPQGRADAATWEAARQAFIAALPDDHLSFLSGLEVAVTCGDYLFVHAGVRPGIPLSLQTESDLLWIRDDFLNAERACEKVVVHGHTPEVSPHIGRHRIGIDTGAYATANLTAVRLHGIERRVIQAGLSG